MTGSELHNPFAEKRRWLSGREPHPKPLHRVAVQDRQRLLGEWRLVEQLGSSAFSRVYAACPVRQEGTSEAECDYAVKELIATDEAAQVRFRREAAIGKHLAHANLMPTLAARLDDKAPYFVMPHVRGATLGTVLRVCGAFTIARSMWIARQLAEALGYLHQAGWIHTDLKPDNVLLSTTGHVTLFDLGLAVNLEEAAGGDYDAFHGTMQFAAPELFTSTRRLCTASDVYSLGATLYQLLTGHAPFECQCPKRLAQAHLQSVAPSARSYLPQLPSSIARLIERMLSKEPNRRPSTDGELQDELICLEIESFSLRNAAINLAA